MSIDKFYMLSSKLSSTTIQAHAMGLDKIMFSDNSAAEWHLISGDYSDISFPVLFKQQYGNQLRDLLDTGWPSLFLISNRLRAVLEESALTGWATFDIRILDKQGQAIMGYHGLSITGRCGMIDYSRSEIIERPLVPNGSPVRYYKGLYIGLNEWDKTDFFLPQNYFGIMTTQRAADALKKNKFTNIRLEKLSEIEIDYSAVQIFSQSK